MNAPANGRTANKNMPAHPHALILSALFISLAAPAFNLLGDGPRDAPDARMRGAA